MLSFIIWLIVYIALNYVWVNYIGKKITHDEIWNLVTRYPNTLAASISAITTVLGLYLFALQPVSGWLLALVYGAFFWLIVYTIYHTTNKSMIIGRTWRIALFDITQGMIACGLINLTMFFVQ
jgi:uncharacterized membrane protein